MWSSKKRTSSLSNALHVNNKLNEFVSNSGFGPQGPTGPIGIQGPKGLDGTASFTGATGEQGPTGQGRVGPIGQRGPQGPTGTPKSIIGGSAKTTNSQTTFLGLFKNENSLIDESQVQYAMPFSGTLSKFYVILNKPAITGINTGSRTFTIRKNEISTSVTVTFNNSSTTITSDTINTVSFSEGDRLSVSSACSGTTQNDIEVRWTALFS